MSFFNPAPSQPAKNVPRDPNIPRSIPDRLQFSFWPPRLRTPPPYDDLFRSSRDTQSMAQDVLEGFKVDIPRSISEFFAAHHSFVLSNDQNVQKYSFAVSGMPTPYTAVQGRIDSDWNVQGKWNTTVTPRFAVTFNAQASQEEGQSGCSFESEYRGTDWFGGFMWANPGIYRVTYCQSITKRFAMGGELAYNHRQAASFGSIGAIFRGNRWAVSGMLSFPQLQLSFFKKLSPRLRVAVDFNAQLGQNGLESRVDFAAVASIAKRRAGRYTVATHIGSDWHVHTSINMVAHEDIRLTLGGDFDYGKAKYNVGIGLTMS